MSVTQNDPELLMSLIRMEARFEQLITQIKLIFNALIRFMKDGNVRQFRAAKVGMREYSETLRLALETATGHLRSLPVP